jgi:hypothetical protein
MSDLEPVKRIWAAQTGEPFVMSEAAVKSRAGKFRSTIWWRNAREHVACAFVVLFFGYVAVMDANPVKQAGAAMVVAAALFVSRRLARSSGGESAGSTWFEHYRNDLMRQHALLSAVWRWYALPFVPGILVMTAARHAYPDFKLHEPAAWLSMLWPAVFVGAIFGGVVWLNAIAARRLRRDIGELDAAKGE